MKKISGTFITEFLLISALLVCTNIPLSAQKPFFNAIKNGDIKVVSSYISKGINSDAIYSETIVDGISNKKYAYSFDPLEYAAWNNQIEVVKLLIANKEKITGYQNSLNKAFSSSISNENPELTRLFLDAGADVNARCQICYGRAAIHIALEYANFALFNELLKRGARLDVTDKMGRTLLHSVATNGNISIAGELLKANLDINAKDSTGSTPVLYAAANGYLKLLKFFEEKGADLRETENDGSGILVQSVNGENDTLVSYLISKNFEINVVNEDNWTPLLYACHNNNLAIVKTLIKGGADVNIANNKGEEPLLWALWNKNSEMARIIIDAGADLNVYDFRPIARKNIKDKSFLKYLDEKYKNGDSGS